MCICANKVPGIRAAVCHDPYSAERSRKSNNAQIMCMGERVIGAELAKTLVDTWLSCEFAGWRQCPQGSRDQPSGTRTHPECRGTVRQYQMHPYEVKNLMLDVKKTILADGIPFLYAAAQVMVDGRRYYVVSSENPGGKALLIDAETEECFLLPDGPGGVMTFIQAPGESAMLSIEEFYPVFNSASAKIIKTELHRQGGSIKVKKHVLAEVPYVHRISLLREADGLYLAAGILCRQKACSDDWSTPGSLKIGKYDPNAWHIELRNCAGRGFSNTMLCRSSRVQMVMTNCTLVEQKAASVQYGKMGSGSRSN